MKTGKLAGVAALTLLGCIVFGGNPKAGEEKQKPAVAPEARELAVAHNKFGVDLFRKLHKNGENTFISPTSIAVCVQMVRQGAGGDTRAEMDKAMYLDGIDVPKSNKALLKELNSRQDVKLKIANSVWADPARVSIGQEYADEVVESFDSEARVADFGDPKTLDAINGWISDRTEALIPRMLDEVSDTTVMFLINAIYFKGAWTDKFDKKDTKEGDWHNGDGSTKKIQLMMRSDRIAYGETDGHQLARLPYGADEQSSMLIVLPKDTATLDTLVQKLTPEDVTKWGRLARERQGVLKLPRFEMKYKETLNDVLKEAGIKTAFELGKADFTRMGESSMGPIFLSRVLHEARVIVNEEGTEAAAATIADMRAGGMPPKPFEMTCDRPFLFFITDDATGAVLFMGTVYQPEDPSR
ncbi:MAG: serpin family protein [Planctomycetes bacterium]|nr:serpin family protein [Planctomycetota bacterium]